MFCCESLQYIQNGRDITVTVLRALEVANTVDSVSGSLTLLKFSLVTEVCKELYVC